MEKFEFTPAGVQDFQTYVYALAEAEIQVIADDAAADFAAWVRQFFVLSSSQDQFLDSLSPHFITGSGLDTQTALLNRLPIYLIKPDPAGAQLRTDKYIRRKKNTEETATATGGYTITGDLTFEIID